MLWLRHRDTTSTKKSPEPMSLDQFSMNEAVAECGNRSAARMSNTMRVGSATPSPKATASPVPMVGMNSSMEAAASEMPARTISWSRSLERRIAKMVLHCDRIVGSSSAGRCDTMHSETPYLRPSLAIREIDRLVGSKPWLRSIGT